MEGYHDVQIRVAKFAFRRNRRLYLAQCDTCTWHTAHPAPYDEVRTESSGHEDWWNRFLESYNAG